MGGRRGSPAQAKAKVAPIPAVLPHTTQPSQPAQPSPSNWNRAAFTTIFIAIAIPFAGWFSDHLSPASVFRCLNHVNQWRHQCGFWSAVEIGVAECVRSNNIPLVSVVWQYGTTLPDVYPEYESQIVQHSLMLETAKRPGVHAFYAEAGMGKSTVAAAVLQELHDQNVSVAFVTFEMPGQLNLEVATALQTTPDRLSHDLHGALLQLKDRGFRKAVLVIDALDEHELTSADEETIKALAGVSWKLLRHHIDFAVICLIRKLETKKRFAQMNGGHKITGGLATEACPNVSTETLRSYASRLNATGNFEEWTNEAPYLIVVWRFAEGLHSKAEIVQQFQKLCSGVILHELETTPLPSSGTSTEPKPVWVRELELRKEGGEIKEADTSPFKIKESVADVDDLKRAIKKEAELTIPAFMINVYSFKDGRWEKENVMSKSLRDTDESDCYGFLLPG